MILTQNNLLLVLKLLVSIICGTISGILINWLSVLIINKSKITKDLVEEFVEKIKNIHRLLAEKNYFGLISKIFNESIITFYVIWLALLVFTLVIYNQIKIPLLVIIVIFFLVAAIRHEIHLHKTVRKLILCMVFTFLYFFLNPFSNILQDIVFPKHISIILSCSDTDNKTKQIMLNVKDQLERSFDRKDVDLLSLKIRLSKDIENDLNISDTPAIIKKYRRNGEKSLVIAGINFGYAVKIKIIPINPEIRSLLFNGLEEFTTDEIRINYIKEDTDKLINSLYFLCRYLLMCLEEDKCCGDKNAQKLKDMAYGYYGPRLIPLEEIQTDNELALIYTELAGVTKNLTLISKAREMQDEDSRFWETDYISGKIHFDCSNYKDAIKDFELSIAQLKKVGLTNTIDYNNTLFHLAVSKLMVEGDYNSVLKLFKECDIRKQLDKSQFLTYYGLCLIKNESFTEAQTMLFNAVNENKKNYFAKLLILRSKIEKNNFQGELVSNIVEQLLGLAKVKENDYKLECYFYIGRLYELLADTINAKNYYSKVIDEKENISNFKRQGFNMNNIESDARFFDTKINEAMTW